MSKRRFIVAEFSDGIQVIPKIWLQTEDLCQYPSYYKTDSRIRKAIEKEEIPKFDWPSFKINRIFGKYSSLQKADEKAEKAMYTSDMDTEKEAKSNRKFRAKKVVSSSGSEEETCTSIILPCAPHPPVKRRRQYDTNERGNSSTMWDSAQRYDESQKVSNSNSHSFEQDANNNYNISYERDEEAHNTDAVYTREENRQNMSNRYVDIIGRLNCTQENRQGERKNDHLNYQPSQDAIVNHLKRLTREITTIKYDMRQTLTLLDILVKRTNETTEARNTKFSFEDAENYFPLQTAVQIVEIEEILKHRDSQHNGAIRAYIKSIGGTNVDDAVKRTLYKIFSNKLAEKYNWEGRRGKEPLHKLELIKVIFRSILHNIPDSDQGKIQRRIMEWFRHSKARHQNEEKRQARMREDNVPFN